MIDSKYVVLAADDEVELLNAFVQMQDGGELSYRYQDDMNCFEMILSPLSDSSQ